MTLPALLILIWVVACGVDGHARKNETAWIGVKAQNVQTVKEQSQIYSDQAMALPPGKLKQSEGYHDYMDRMTKKQQLAVNELTNILDGLERRGWTDFYLNDRPVAPQGKTFAGRFRTAYIYGRSA